MDLAKCELEVLSPVLFEDLYLVVLLLAVPDSLDPLIFILYRVFLNDVDHEIVAIADLLLGHLG